MDKDGSGEGRVRDEGVGTVASEGKVDKKDRVEVVAKAKRVDRARKTLRE